MNALAYAIITLGNTVLTGVMSGWLIYFYLPPNGNPLVPVGLFGLAVLLSRISHIIANLLVHRFVISTTNGRLWQVLLGALFMPGLFMMLWLPPQTGESSTNLWHLTMTLVAFNSAAGIHQAGYEALFPRFSQDSAVSNWRMSFLLLGNILAGLTGPLIQATSYTQAILIFTLGSAPFLIVPGIFLRARFRGETRPLEHSPLLDAVRAAWAKPAFRAFACSWGLMWLATTFTFETLPYIATQICQVNVGETAYFYLAPIVVSALAYPLTEKLSKRYGAGNVYRASLLAGAVAMPGLLLVNTAIPIPLLAQGLLWLALQTVCLSGAQSAPGTLIAEITADAPGQQGPLYAFGNLVDQFSSGLALAFISFFMLFGYTTIKSDGIRLLAPAGAIFLLAAFFVWGRYQTHRDGQA